MTSACHFVVDGERCYYHTARREGGSHEIHDTTPSDEVHDPFLALQHLERSAPPILGNDEREYRQIIQQF